MNFLQAFTLGVRNLTRRKLRAWLTIIGIFIGIAAVVSLVSVSQGLKTAIADQFSQVGADKLFIQPKSNGFGPPGIGATTQLTKTDEDKIKKVNGVKLAAGFSASNFIKLSGSTRVFSPSLIARCVPLRSIETMPS